MVAAKESQAPTRIGLKQYVPFLLASGVLLAAVFWLLFRTIQQNGGHFTYVLDDPYIHMAMAKNVVQHGVWGVTKYGFSSSSSSLLWTLLLAGAYAAFGSTVWTPFVLNIVCAVLLLFGIHRVLLRHDVSGVLASSVLLAVVFVTPLPILIFGGQEHILHALLTIVIVYLASHADVGHLDSELTKWVLVVAPLVTMARYEGVFVIAVICLLIMLRRSVRVSAAVALLGAIPLIVYGAFSVIQGWYLLPNSVLLKGDTPDVSSILGMVDVFGFGAFKKLTHVPALWMLIAGALLLLHVSFHHRRSHRRIRFILTAFLLTSALHLQFARIGWAFRYEAYLVSLGIFTIGVSLSELSGEVVFRSLRPSVLRRHAIIALLVLFASLAFLQRGTVAWQTIPGGTRDVYDQQYQIAMFLDRFYDGESVALNDIGAANYYANVRSLDLLGLANIDVARARRNQTFDAGWVSESAQSRNVKVAIVYERWLGEYIPSTWVKVGEWHIRQTVTAGDDTIAFYARNSADASELAENLTTFASHLPADVVQRGEYMRSSSNK